MKSSIRFGWLAFGVGLWLATAPAMEAGPDSAGQNTRYVMGLSPFLDKGVKDEVYRRIIGFLLEDLPMGSSLWIYDAFHLRTIAQVDVPTLRAFRSAKTRANQFKEPVRKLKDFLAADHERPAVRRLSMDQAVRLPQFLDFVGDNLARGGHTLVVVVLGSPLYLDPKEPGFSMVDGYFPSDGHLLASREQSVYGLKDRAGALRDMVIHFGYVGDPWVSAVHQEKIARFWALYLDGQGARLDTFCGDLPTLFNAARSRSVRPTELSPPRHQINPAETKLEMLRITRDIGVADWITRDTVPNAAMRPPASLVGPMKIGIRWKGNIDLDLYAAAHHRSEVLYFEHTRSPEGYYFKDHRSSPQREFEFIEFEKPVDVRRVEAKINFYKGSAPGGASGEIRVEFEGKIYTGQFALAAEHGNEGRSSGNQEKFWATIDLPRLLKLDREEEP